MHSNQKHSTNYDHLMHQLYRQKMILESGGWCKTFALIRIMREFWWILFCGNLKTSELLCKWSQTYRHSSHWWLLFLKMRILCRTAGIFRRYAGSQLHAGEIWEWQIRFQIIFSDIKIAWIKIRTHRNVFVLN